MRTQQEILNKMLKLSSKQDFFGFIHSDLIQFLEYEHAKDWLENDVTEETWDQIRKTPDDKTIKEVMADYMPFAFLKANNCRGLSAMRTLYHFTAWIWLLGDETVEYFGDLLKYEYYGKPHLIKICKYLNLDHTKWDNGVLTNVEI